MGSSNPHPHGQAWSTSSIPSENATELASMTKYAADNDGKCLLCEYATLEMKEQARVVFSNDHFVVVVPWWAVWPFEVLGKPHPPWQPLQLAHPPAVLPYRRHITSIAELDEAEQLSFADALGRITIRYDNVFRTTFPYVFGIHQRPVPKTADANSGLDLVHLHTHFYPPLLRSASVRKFPAG